MKTLKNIPNGSKITIDSSNAIHVDQDVLEILDDFKENAVHRDIELHLINTPVKEFENPLDVISRSDHHSIINEEVEEELTVEQK